MAFNRGLRLTSLKEIGLCLSEIFIDLLASVDENRLSDSDADVP